MRKMPQAKKLHTLDSEGVQTVCASWLPMLCIER